MVREHVLVPVGRWDARFLLGFLGAHAVPGVESWDHVTFSRSVRTPAGVAVVELREAPAGRLAVRVHGRVDDGPLLGSVRHLTAVDDDCGPAEAAFASDSVLGPLVRRRPGLRVPGCVDAVETVVRTVVGQQVSVAAARTTTGRLVAAAGQPLPAPLRGVVPGVTHLFPSADRLAGLDPEALPMPRARGRCLVGLGAALGDAAAVARSDKDLLALPGVGEWSVSYTRLRTQRDPDVFLATDLAVRRQMGLLGMASDVASVRALSERWAPYRSLAMLHLWAEYLARGRRAA